MILAGVSMLEDRVSSPLLGSPGSTAPTWLRRRPSAVGRLMRRSHARAVVLAADAGLAAGVRPLLSRMRRDFEDASALRASTIAIMYGMYATFAAAGAVAVGHRIGEGRRRSATLTAAGGAIGAAGITVAAAGIGLFDSADEVSGGCHSQLFTRGVYAVTRNPQYVGLVAAMGGLALARRSAVVAAMAVGYAATVRAWVPAEEAALTREFDSAYRVYCQRVPRWLGPAARRYERHGWARVYEGFPRSTTDSG